MPGVRQSRLVLAGLLIWLGSFVAYCVLQTIANKVSVQVQDALLLALPVVQAVTVGFALRAGPPLQLPLRVALGGVAAWVFGGLYQAYFTEIIVHTFHIWDRHEGGLQPIRSFIGFLILVGIFGALIGAALIGSRRRNADT